MKELTKIICPHFIHKIYADIKFYIRFKFNPKGLASEIFRGILGYEMDWNNPQDINEKINWMKFNYDTSEWTRLADKYLVREYVKERIGEDVLPKLYGVWNRVEDIDFDLLPSKFVFKTNQGAGTVMLIPDKSKLNIKETKERLNEWMKIVYGYKTIEPHYMKIKPLITAEEFLDNKDRFSSSLVDYKIFCLSGKPFCILVCTDRILCKHTNMSFYDCNWKLIPDILAGRHKEDSTFIPRPTCLTQLLEYATTLAEGHPQVRVDFYIVNNKIYFGEMTFTSQGGFMDYISREYSQKMGNLINLTSLN